MRGVPARSAMAYSRPARAVRAAAARSTAACGVGRPRKKRKACAFQPCAQVLAALCHCPVCQCAHLLSLVFIRMHAKELKCRPPAPPPPPPGESPGGTCRPPSPAVTGPCLRNCGIITLQLPLSIHSVVGFQQPAPTHTSTTASHQNVPAAVPACMCGCRQQCHM